MMESSEEPTSLQSICALQASELYPKHKIDFSEPELAVPFELLSGEYLIALGRTSDGVLALSNYRLYVYGPTKGCHNILLGLIEHLEVKEIFFLHIGCKDARSYSCSFTTNDQCTDWYKRIHKVILPKKSIDDMFSFAYYAWTKEEGKEYPRLQKDTTNFIDTFNAEVNRLKFNVNGTWRISQINKDYQMCPSYPPQLLVPACISDQILEAVAKFRSSRRIPSVVWRHTGNGAVIARSSQPEVGWLGWRSSEDEDLLKALADACSYDRGDSTGVDSPDFDAEDEPARAPPPKKVLIIDARSYATAVANRARGGGCECPEYYPSSDIQFMNLANIHAIRKSFHQLRQLCSADADQNWLSALDATKWMQNMSGLLRAAVTVARAIEIEGRPVLVHCSDGWDRTPQIVALAQILLDPYYRTMEGFKVLVEKEWLDFGHKFADRCGHTVGCEDPNERCPVFLQWLDCVYQISKQFKCSFEMSSLYFVKLAQHVFSQLFGTFLCNTRHERLQLGVRERSFSVWQFLNSTTFQNGLYDGKNNVLWPSFNVRDLKLWSDVYLGTVEPYAGTNDSTPRVPVIDIENNDSDELQGQMTKTRSFGDLIQVQDHTSFLPRRLSDPNIAIEKKFEGNVQKEPEKVETLNGCANESDNDDSEIINTTYKETESKKNLLNGEQESVDLPTSNSGDSSTDTLIPNGDAILAKYSVEKEPVLTNHVQNGENNHFVEPTSVTCHSSVRNQNFNHVNDTTESNGVPVSSRISSSTFPASPTHHQDKENFLVDYDGLPLTKGDEVQERVAKLINEHTVVVEALKKELYATRLALINHVSNSNIIDSDRVSDVSSLPDSVGSTVDHGESVPSDLSWEALEEPVAPTRWVPDHVVNMCTGCSTVFWLGRRKHHCRCCGDIFCADCSENWTPVPNEQLYNPVRVCQKCFLQMNPGSSRQLVEQQHQSNGLVKNYAIDAIIESHQQQHQQQHSMPLPQPIMACHRSARKGKDECCDSAFQQKTIVEASTAN
ncbi:myotubularin-related protein 3 [Copidosoma floridanum]|uniref:myotubularin-related protein 3 n=1 Tax=Copidosoma floridanum TaxID=29053 RepID=UPI0006C9715D|nr:myotubularin-related protein 3 [Copidosoma floridanum]